MAESVRGQILHCEREQCAINRGDVEARLIVYRVVGFSVDKHAVDSRAWGRCRKTFDYYLSRRQSSLTIWRQPHLSVSGGTGGGDLLLSVQLGRGTKSTGGWHACVFETAGRKWKVVPTNISRAH